MGKHTSLQKRLQIVKALSTTAKNHNQIAVEFDVNYSVVQRLARNLEGDNFAAYYRHEQNKEGRTPTSEEEMLSSPFYGGINKELITPIREDWKLITYTDE